MPYNIRLYFRLPYCYVSNCALFSTRYFSTLILYRRSLDTFYQEAFVSMEIILIQYNIYISCGIGLLFAYTAF